ncbi:MAG: MFS transporter [Bacteroidia bacterium]|nr:MFS transporter [Bacteroidia bacterium]
MSQLLTAQETSVSPYHWRLFSLCVVVYLLCGTIATLISVYLPVVVNELLGDTTEVQLGEYGAYINAAFLYGMTAGGLILGILSDRIGRRYSLVLATTVYGLFTCLIVSVPNWQLLVVYRFFAGMGVAGVLLITTVLLSEVWPERGRAVFQGILALTFPVGIVVSGGLKILITDWRMAGWLGLIPLAVTLLMLIGLKESEAWEKTRKRTDKKKLFSSENQPILVRGATVYGSVLIGLWAVFSWTPTWISTLPGSDAQQAEGFIMMILGMGGITGGIFSGFLVNRLGLRFTLLGTFAACFLLCCLLFMGNRVFSPWIYVEASLLALFFGISQGALSVYVPQLFPFEIRATATGFCFNIGRLFTASGVFFIGALVGILQGFAHAILLFSIFFLVAFAAVFLQSKT